MIQLGELLYFICVQSGSFGKALAIFRISQVAVSCMAVFDIFSNRSHIFNCVFDQELLLLFCEHEPEITPGAEAVICGVILRVVAIQS